MSDQQIITQEGYEKLKQELDHRCTAKRREIADRIQSAKDLGDLSENAEYTEAKEEHGFNEGRIAELQQILKNITIVKNNGNNGKVGLGSKVIVKVNGQEKEYTIVSFNEADPLNGKISNESPLGLAFIGRSTGEKVLVNTPKGEFQYEIVRIS